MTVLLRASDVAMLKMNADFVVLSACNTAAGDKPGAEALSGLARAFFYAGAKSLVVSHWEVDSDATVELMDGLFEALKSESSSLARRGATGINVADDRQFIEATMGTTDVLGAVRRRWRASKALTLVTRT